MGLQSVQAREALIKPGSDLRRAYEVARRDGVFSLFAKAKMALLRRLDRHEAGEFDRRFGVDTCGLDDLQRLDVKGGLKQANRAAAYYEGISIRVFRKLMAEIREDLSDFTFVDYGSGKGRALLLASEYEFKKIVGVEFARELHEVAANNIARFHSRRQKCRDIESAHVDATEFAVPDGKCVLFFYNPFGDPTMGRVAGEIAASYQEKPRRMYVIYCSPNCAERFDELGFLVPIAKGQFLTKKAIVYKSIA